MHQRSTIPESLDEHGQDDESDNALLTAIDEGKSEVSGTGEVEDSIEAGDFVVLSIECFDCVDGGDCSDEVACCVGEMCFFEVDVSLHLRRYDDDDDDDDRERSEDDEGQVP